MEGGELDGEASANSQPRLIPVKVEPPDNEPEDGFHAPMKKEEIITDDVPPQINLAPIPMKLIEAATGKLIQYQPVVENPDDEAGEVDPPITQEPLVLIKQEPDENASEDDECSRELPYCPTELVQTSFGTYDMPEVKCELGKDPENGKKVRLVGLRKRHLGGGGDSTLEEAGDKELVPPLKIKLRPFKETRERYGYEGRDRLASGVDGGWGEGYTGHVVGCEERCRKSAEEGSTSEASMDCSEVRRGDASDGEAGLQEAPRKGRRRRRMLDSLRIQEGIHPRKRGRRPKSTRDSSGNKTRGEATEDAEESPSQTRKRSNKDAECDEDGSEASGHRGEGGSSSGRRGGAKEATSPGQNLELGEGSSSGGERSERKGRISSSETEEERQSRLKKQREMEARILANETEEEKKERLEIMRERKLGSETEDLKEDECKGVDEEWTKLEMKRKKAEMSKLARIVETPEERKRRLEILKMSQKKHLAKETPEQRRNRLEKMKAYQARRLENETPEERENRLQRARKYTAQRGARKKQTRRGKRKSKDD